eukprot:XP_011668532.1 PREDICTED: myb-related transcription factor, partner of profilin-like [Strongylocentrotus purpuratus]
MSAVNGKKRERKANFSIDEQACLVRYVEGNEEALFSKAAYCGKKVEKRKRDAWEKGATTLRASGGSERTGEELKRKWQELKSKALRVRAMSKMTGGGPAPQMSFIDSLILDMLDPEVVDGIQNSQTEAGVDFEEDNAATGMLGAIMGAEGGQLEEDEDEGEEGAGAAVAGEEGTGAAVAGEKWAGAAVGREDEDQDVDEEERQQERGKRRCTTCEVYACRRKLVEVEEERNIILGGILQVLRERLPIV